MIDTIKAERTRLKVTQRELARRLGKPPSFVNKIEQLERRLDVLEFIAIAEALGLAATGLIESVRVELPATVAI